MKERAKELKSKAKAEDLLKELLAKIAEMPPADRKLAERIHELVMNAGPGLIPKTWYGMPAYAKCDKVVVFFKGADKFGERYATLGFNEPALLDEGSMWPTSYAITQLTPADEKLVSALVAKAVGSA